MRRGIVIALFGILAAGVLIGGGLLVWQFFTGEDVGEGLGLPGTVESPAPGGLQPAGEAGDQIIDLPQSEQDSDGDGLSNTDELLWRTDPNNPDTDGDGYLDGEEVAANHDPRVPAPNDELPEGYVPGQAAPGQPLSELSSDPGKYDHLFQEGLDLTISSGNLTEDFRNSYPEGEQNQATMASYAQEQAIIQALPEPSDDFVPDEGSEDTAASLLHYLSVANNPNVLANSTLYRQAQYDLQTNANPATMLSLAELVRTYRQSVGALNVPNSAMPTHKLLISYTEQLAATLDQIALWPEDPVKSMAATRQLEYIDTTYYPLIAQEFDRLLSLQQRLAAGG